MATVTQTPKNLRKTDRLDLNNPLLEKYFAAVKRSHAGTTTVSVVDDGTTYCTSASGEMTLPTPPPEAMAPHYSYELQESNSPIDANSEYQYIKGSSLEETPASSPSGSDGGAEEAQNVIVKQENTVLPDVDTAASPSFAKSVKSENVDSSDEEEAPKNVKMPQRKGGMQLWQFLYTLLTDPDKKYKELIEWTSNSKAREFRLLEPEAIAIWWGEHKNKRSMSYDKLSRSLRYYYDKGIIRKVSGERYVYQFCLNPELMYQHIGNSKCRPRLKPMPTAAKHATSKYQMQHAHYEVPLSDPIFIAQGPVALGSLNGQLPSYLHHHPSELGYMPPPPMPLELHQQMMAEQQMMLGVPQMPGFGHQHIEDSAEPLSMRCNSFNSFPYSTPEHKMSYDQLYTLSTASVPTLVETIPYDHSPSLSPATTSSENSSPTHYTNFVNPLANSSDIDLDTLIEITYASSDGYTHSPASYSTACDSGVMVPPPDWSYN